MEKYLVGLLSDEIAEEIESMNENSGIIFDQLIFTVPRSAIRSNTVDSWRSDIKNGLHNYMDVYTMGSGTRCGPIPVKTICNMLSGRPFIIRNLNGISADARIINNIEELARLMDAIPAELPFGLMESVDYETHITWTADAVQLMTIEHLTKEYSTVTLPFPFTDSDYSDAVIGLQSWAYTEYIAAAREGLDK